jgi:N-acetyl-1-D-myo-inositol-2-amino-2-deoxy-alpha-D-glucopyranoside deacetylase
MREHATQISVEDGFFALSNNLGSRAMGIEHFRLVRGATAAPYGPHGWETDLFAGV